MPDLYIDEPVTPTTAQPQTAPTQKAQTEPKPKALPGQVELKKSEPHILASYHENPEGVVFENQEPGEKVLLFLRRHYITNISWQSLTIVLLILPLFAMILYPYLTLPIEIPLRFIIITLLFYYLIVIGYAFLSFVVWFYNVGLVSSLRVVDIDVNNIDSKDIAATELRSIIDVSYKQSGFKQSLFDYGDVFLETQANTPNLEFLQIPHPARVTDLITKLMTKTL